MITPNDTDAGHRAAGRDVGAQVPVTMGPTALPHAACSFDRDL